MVARRPSHRPSSDGTTLRTSPSLNGCKSSVEAGHANHKEEYGTGFQRPDTDTSVQRPALTHRVSSSERPRLESPAMARADDAYTDLAHGMHHNEDRPANMRSNSRIV